jgi:hypothetical protein
MVGTIIVNGAGTDDGGTEITDGCDLPENSIHLMSNGDVLYNVPTDIAGYQFNIEGTTAAGASGGESQSAGFTVSAGGSTVLAFSFTGATVSNDCGLLTTLALNGEATGLSSLVFSDAAAATIPVEYFDGGDNGGDTGGVTEMAMVQIIHNSASPTVDVYVDGALAIEDFTYRSATGILELPTSFTVGIAPANDAIIAKFDFNLEDGESYVVVATGLLGNDNTPFDLAATGTTFGSSAADLVGLEVYHGSTDAPAVDV